MKPPEFMTSQIDVTIMEAPPGGLDVRGRYGYAYYCKLCPPTILASGGSLVADSAEAAVEAFEIKHLQEQHGWKP